MKRSVLLVAVLAITFGTGAYAQTQIGLNGVGAKVGYVDPENIEGTIGFGLQAKLGHVVPMVALDAFLDYWSKSYGLLGSDVSFTEIAIGALAKYHFPTPGSFKPYAGAGLALSIGRSKVEWQGIPGFVPGGSESETDTDIAFHIVGGVETPITPLIDGFAELKYAIDGADYLAIMVGAVYKLRK